MTSWIFNILNSEEMAPLCSLSDMTFTLKPQHDRKVSCGTLFHFV